MKDVKIVFFDVEVYMDLFMAVFRASDKDHHRTILLHKRQSKAEFDKNVKDFITIIDTLMVNTIRKIKAGEEISLPLFQYFPSGFNCYNYDIPVVLFLYLYLQHVNKEDQNAVLDSLFEYNTFLLKNNKVYDIMSLSEKVRMTGFNKINPTLFTKIINRLTQDIRLIPCMDLYKVNGWDNEQRSASLKWLAANLGAEEIVESEYDFNAPLLTGNPEEDQRRISSTMRYCLNDVLETIHIFNITAGDVEDRFVLWKDWITKYGHLASRNLWMMGEINKLLRCNRTQLGVQMIKQEMTSFEKSKMDAIKQRRKELYSGDVEKMKISEIVLPKINLNDAQKFYDIKNLDVYVATSRRIREGEEEEIQNTYKSEYTIVTAEEDSSRFPVSLVCHLGLGGIHGCNPGIYVRDDGHIILTFDVASYYPANVISNKWYPRPIGKEFIPAYAGIREKRFSYPKGSSLNKVYKECLNAVIGESKSRLSDIFDYRFFYSVTVNGQLILINLIEELAARFRIYPIMVNTDGGELIVKKEDKDNILKYIEDFGNRFGLTFECDEYSRMIISNVNNYLAFKTKPTTDNDTPMDDLYEVPYVSFVKGGVAYQVKIKGEAYTCKINNEELHRNSSFLVTGKAVLNYYLHGINPIETIRKNRVLKDHLGLLRRHRRSEIYLMDPHSGERITLKRRILRYLMVNYKDIREIANALKEDGIELKGKIGYLVRINGSKTAFIHKNKNFCSLLYDDIIKGYTGDRERLKQKLLSFSSDQFLLKMTQTVLEGVKPAENLINFE